MDLSNWVVRVRVRTLWTLVLLLLVAPALAQTDEEKKAEKTAED